MKRTRIVIVILLLAALLIAVWLLLRQRSSTQDEAGDVTQTNQTTVTRLTPQQRFESIQSRNAARQKLWRGATFAEVNKLAMQGDTLAQLRLSEMYEDCVAYTQTMQDNYRLIGQIAALESEIGHRVSRMLRERHTICAAARAEKRPFLDSSIYWLHSSAKKGDLVAEMRFFSRNTPSLTVKQFDHFLAKTRALPHPDAVYGISTLLSKVDAEITDDPELKPIFAGPLAEHAWAIAACRSGLDCGDGSRLMGMVCLTMFSCEHRNYESFLLSEIIPTTNKAEIDKLVALINNRVLAAQ